MKKSMICLLVLTLVVSTLLIGCTNNDEVVDTPDEVEAVEGKVGIITSTISMTEEEYRSGEAMAKKYGDRIVHVTWPENAAKEQEQMITVLTKLGADSDIKAIVINQAMPGTNAAVDKLREMREDILVIYCNFSENPPDVAARADVGLIGDNMAMGSVFPDQAKKMGAERIIYYSFPRHLSLSIFSVNRDNMKARSEELGLDFIEVTAPDPTGDAGIPGTQQFILEDVPKQIDKYGPDTALYATNCAMQIPLIQRIVELKAIYVLPCCPSPFHGFPLALGLDIPEDKKGDVDYVIEQTAQVLEEEGVRGRFSNFRVPGAYMNTVSATEYALKWMAGETDGRFDFDVLQKIMEEYSGAKMKFSLMEDAGETFDNIIMYLQDFYIY